MSDVANQTYQAKDSDHSGNVESDEHGIAKRQEAQAGEPPAIAKKIGGALISLLMPFTVLLGNFNIYGDEEKFTRKELNNNQTFGSKFCKVLATSFLVIGLFLGGLAFAANPVVAPSLAIAGFSLGFASFYSYLSSIHLNKNEARKIRLDKKHNLVIEANRQKKQEAEKNANLNKNIPFDKSLKNDMKPNQEADKHKIKKTETPEVVENNLKDRLLGDSKSNSTKKTNAISDVYAQNLPQKTHKKTFSPTPLKNTQKKDILTGPSIGSL